MDESKNLLETLEEREALKRHEDVRIYHGLLGNQLDLAEQELLGRSEAWKKIAAVVSEVLSRHKVSDAYPAQLRQRKIELIRKCEGARQTLRDVDPPWLEQKITQIKTRTPQDFSCFSPQAMAGEDSRILACYIGKARGYANFAAEVAEMEQEISRLEAVFQDQIKRGEFHALPAAPRGAFLRDSDNEPPVIKPDFDPR